MVTPYTKGRTFEYRVRDYLRKRGFFVVRQTKSTFPDLIAMRKGKVLLIECKVNGQLSREERAIILSISEATGGKPILAQRTRRSLDFTQVHPNEKPARWRKVTL